MIRSPLSCVGHDKENWAELLTFRLFPGTRPKHFRAVPQDKQ